MKTEKEIKERIKFLEEEKKDTEKEFNRLYQIDALSNIGSKTSDKIERIKGEILALKWTLK